MILCSTGALIGKPNGRNYKLLREFSKKLNCDGFEFMMYNSWYDRADEIVSDIQDMGILTPVMHCEKHIGEAISRNEDFEMEDAMYKFNVNCMIASKIGAKKMVIHLWDGLSSDQYFTNNLETFGKLQKIAKKYDVDLMVENVVCNRDNPMKHWCELADEYPDIDFVFDTKMAAFHKQIDLLYSDDYSWLWREDHIKHIHVNDYAGGYMEWSKLKTLPIGHGHIDFNEFFDFIKQKGYSGDFTVEATAFDLEGNIDFNMLNESFEYIRKKMN